MIEDEDNLTEQVMVLFLRIGAERSQAEVMAKQLLRRANQIAVERKISNTEALESLLKQVLEARQGQ